MQAENVPLDTSPHTALPQREGRHAEDAEDESQPVPRLYEYLRTAGEQSQGYGNTAAASRAVRRI